MVPAVGLAEADDWPAVLVGLVDAIIPRENEDPPDDIERADEEVEAADDARGNGEEEAKGDSVDAAKVDCDEGSSVTAIFIAEEPRDSGNIDAGTVLTTMAVLIGKPLEEITVANVVGIPYATIEVAPVGKVPEAAELAELAELAEKGDEINDDSVVGENGRSAYIVVDMPDPEEPTGRTIGKADDAPNVTTPEYVRVVTGVTYVFVSVGVIEPEGIESANEGEIEGGRCEGEIVIAPDSASMDAVS